MSLYWEGSSSWCSAAPMVRMSAKTSKPSNVHPRFEATSAFHCARFSERYHGEDAIVSVAAMMCSLEWMRRSRPGAIGFELPSFQMRVGPWPHPFLTHLAVGSLPVLPPMTRPPWSQLHHLARASLTAAPPRSPSPARATAPDPPG